MIEQLHERLHVFVDHDDDSDWADVERRVRCLPGPTRLQRRLLLVAAAVLALAALATPALALERGLLPWFRDEPAPPAVENALASRLQAFLRTRPQFANSSIGRLRPANARGLIALDTPIGPVWLWEVPTDRRGGCTLTQVGDRIRGPACSDPSRRWPLSFAWAPVVPGYGLLEGRAFHDVAWIGIRYADGAVEAVPYVEHHFAAVIDLARKPAAIVSRRTIDGEAVESSVSLPPLERHP